MYNDWAFNYLQWRPNKLILFGCTKDIEYCDPQLQEVICIVDIFIARMIIYARDKKK